MLRPGQTAKGTRMDAGASETEKGERSMNDTPFLKRLADHVPDLSSTSLQIENKRAALMDNPVQIEFSGKVSDIFVCGHGEHMTVKVKNPVDQDGESMGVALATCHCAKQGEDEDDIYMAYRYNDQIHVRGSITAFDIMNRTSLTLGEPHRLYTMYLDPCEVLP